MKLVHAILSSTLLLGALASSPKKPHVLFLLADDMGWANIGYNRRSASTEDERQGQHEVQTPTIDGLVDEGIILDRHYSYRICGPARSALLSGRLGTHVLAKNVAVTAHNPQDPVSGFAGIPRNMTGMGMKMRAGGYKTYYTGKWDAGMATPQHTPRGRGFETNFAYYQHANDYWNKKTGIQATGEITSCLNAFYDLMIENDTYRGAYKGPELTDACKDSQERTPACYEEKMFEEYSLNIIRNHDASDQEHPLFLFHAFHLLHTPLQVPNYYFNLINKTTVEKGGKEIDSDNRRLIMAMTKYMDDTIQNLTDALKAKGMWEDTLVVFTTDNGGPLYEPGSANNYPLKGGKYSDFEGGVRTATWMSGGFIPKESRGRVHKGIVSIADWYTIFSELAGVDPEDAEAVKANAWLQQQGLPTLAPVDGKPGQLEAIFKGTPGPRANEPLFISANALLDFPYKLVTGKQPYMVHTGPLYPNCSTIANFENGNGPDFVDFGVFEYKIDLGDKAYWRGDCANGCLYNVEEDPTESHDLSGNPEYQDRLERMIKTLAESNKTLFVPERGETHVDACYSVMFNGGGHFGPFVDIEGYYTEAPRTLQDLNVHELAQMAAITSTELKPLKELLQKFAPGLVLKMLQATGDKCCALNEDQCMNGPTAQNSTEYLKFLESLAENVPAESFSAHPLETAMFI